MKILLCCPYKLDLRLGGAKVYIEVAEAYRQNQHEVTLLGVDDLGETISGLDEIKKLEIYSQALKLFIKKHGNEYDIIEFEYPYLPFPRSEFPKKPLLVARSVLLWHHFRFIKIPIFPTIRGYLGKWLKGRARRRELDIKIKYSMTTMENADIVNVSNPDDKKILREKFYLPENKILNFPYGIFPERRNQLNQIESIAQKKVNIVFIGTFDPRKGAVEFPAIVQYVLKKFPQTTFTLLGTSAMFPTKESVLKKFPESAHGHLNIITKFSPEELPALLASSTLGLFPSYLEGFSFGILEMMTKGLPVVSYQSPGPNYALPSSLLVAPGQWKAMAEKICQLISDEDLRKTLALECQSLSKQYDWKKIASETIQSYLRYKN